MPATAIRPSRRRRYERVWLGTHRNDGLERIGRIRRDRPSARLLLTGRPGHWRLRDYGDA